MNSTNYEKPVGAHDECDRLIDKLNAIIDETQWKILWMEAQQDDWLGDIATMRRDLERFENQKQSIKMNTEIYKEPCRFDDLDEANDRIEALTVVKLSLEDAHAAAVKESQETLNLALRELEKKNIEMRNMSIRFRLIISKLQKKEDKELQLYYDVITTAQNIEEFDQVSKDYCNNQTRVSDTRIEVLENGGEIAAYAAEYLSLPQKVAIGAGFIVISKALPWFDRKAAEQLAPVLEEIGLNMKSHPAITMLCGLLKNTEALKNYETKMKAENSGFQAFIDVVRTVLLEYYDNLHISNICFVILTRFVKFHKKLYPKKN